MIYYMSSNIFKWNTTTLQHTRCRGTYSFTQFAISVTSIHLPVGPRFVFAYRWEAGWVLQKTNTAFIFILYDIKGFTIQIEVSLVYLFSELSINRAKFTVHIDTTIFYCIMKMAHTRTHTQFTVTSDVTDSFEVMIIFFFVHFEWIDWTLYLDGRMETGMDDAPSIL